MPVITTLNDHQQQYQPCTTTAQPTVSPPTQPTVFPVHLHSLPSPPVLKYPELEKWLKGDPTAKSTLEVWGPYKPSFGNIPIVVKEYLVEIAEKRMQDKEKEKEKKKSAKHLKKNLM
ncbi:hypothetical protein BDQ12DRAFT_728311 [Crucibulum laeve]|uniref:Uncharacterized protein n=1 Tax=Crucibulum laeve TaxID=68775 RepID=A0A5C3LJ41_9AGAR|nr:hypothetical protein BDQ12DRAFT_728311 [Crucibulum laeve]